MARDCSTHRVACASSGELDVLRAAQAALHRLPGLLELAQLVRAEAAVIVVLRERAVTGHDVVVGVHGGPPPHRCPAPAPH